MPFRSLTVLIALAFAFLLPAKGEETSVTAQVLSNKVNVGEIGVLMVKIHNGDARLPREIEAEGLEIASSGQSVSMDLSPTGTQVMEVTYDYRFRGNETGTYTIPPIPMTIRGQEFKTDPIVVTIVEPDPNPDATKPYFGRLQTAKPEAFVNEIVSFDLAAYVRGRNAIVEVIGPMTNIAQDNFVFRRLEKLSIGGKEVGNNYFSVATVQSTFFALKPGTHRIAPAQIGVKMIDSNTSFPGFGNFSRPVNRPLATNSVEMQIKALPDGAPPSFTGGVGNFEMEAKASSTELNLGDPVSMEFVVTGFGNLTTMSAPVFTESQTGIWKTFEPGKEIQDLGDKEENRKGKAVFSRVIIPETGTDVIPPFALTFFDPEKEKYITRSTDPIPIRINTDAADPPTTATDFPAAGAQPPGGAPADTPSAEFNDILYIRTAQPRWLSQAPAARPGLLFYVIQTLFSIALFTIVGFGITRFIRGYQVRRKSAEPVLTFRQSLKKVPGPGSPKREFFHAVSTAILLWQREHPDASSEVMDVIGRIADRCESILYGGTEELEARVSAMEAAEYVSLLDKLPRR